MRDILADLRYWLEESQSIALATVVQTWGSSPRGVGSKMAFTATGKITGSVSGGCVESAVIEAGNQTLKTKQPQLLHFGVSDETAWEVGLACGGSIEVFVKPLDRVFFEKFCSALEEDQPVVTATVIRGPDDILGRERLMYADHRANSRRGDHWDEQISNLASDIIIQGSSQRVALSDEIEVFFDVHGPPLTLIVIGGAHITIALTSLAKTLGYRTIVIDPRRVWGNPERFPDVDQLIQAWPDEALQGLTVTGSTAIAMLTHDPKIDDPALKIALSGPAFYVGALGSRVTQAKRRERLLRDGLTESQLTRLHAPIGLDIGAQTPEEVALAIMAEVVTAHRKRKQENERAALRQPLSG